MSYMKHYGEKFLAFKTLLSKEAPVILEIGAHYGEDSMRFAETFQHPRIYSFEPDPRNVDVFKKYVDNPSITLHEIALSDVEGSLEFYRSYDPTPVEDVPEKYGWISKDDYVRHMLNNSGSSSLKRGYGKTLSESILVPTRRYDNWASENGVDSVDLAWIDVQGGEREVLDGMGTRINDILFVWIEYGAMEYEGAMDRSSTIDFMRRLGFGLMDLLSSRPQVPSGDLMFCNLKK